MKNEMRSYIKTVFKYVGLAVICIVAGVALWLANGLVGNPVSKALARRGAEQHIAATYPDKDFVLDEVYFDFKSGNYGGKISSPTSRDSHFTVYLDMAGKALGDSYEQEVVSGWNTYQRLDDAYRQMVEAVFSAPDFPLKSDLSFGALQATEKQLGGGPAFGMGLEALVLDGEYDVAQLGKTAGRLVYYAQTEELTAENAARLLLLLKQRMEEAGVPFYAIDFILELPRTEEKPRVDADYYSTDGFLSADIYRDGLEERLAGNHDALMARYAQADKEQALAEEAMDE